MKSTDGNIRPGSYAGWLLFFGLLALGNTVLGMLVLLIDRVVRLASRIRSGKGTSLPGIRRPIAGPIAGWRTPTILCAAFSAVVVLSAAFSDYKSHAFITSLVWFLWWWLVIEGSREMIGNTDFLRNRVLPLFWAGAVVSAVIALVSYFGFNMPRARTLGALSNGLGTLMTLSIIITAGAAEECSGWRKFLYLGGIPFMLGALLVSFSRGSWLGFIAGMVVYALKDRKRTIAFLVLLAIVGTVVADVDPLATRFQSIFDLNRNSDRINIWINTLAMIKDNPVLGVGPGLYPFVYPEYRILGDPVGTMPFAHNLPLQILAEFGILGFLSFGALIGYIAYCSIRLSSTGRPIYRALLAAFVGIMVHQMFDNDILGMNIGGAFWLVVGSIIWSYELEYLRDHPVRSTRRSHSLDSGSAHS